MRLLGAALIIGTFGGAGLAAAGELERRLALLRDMGRVAEQMRTEVCLRRLPLPEVLRVLAEEHPRYFAGADEFTSRLDDFSFAELWRACIKTFDLPAEAERALIRLGEELSCGETPEDAFDRCREELRRLCALALENKDRNSRLYPMLGLALGCLLVIVLL